MLERAFESITAEDLDRLVGIGVEESLTLEFKAQLPGSRDNDKREFLKDVTAFANSQGGDLLYGIAEEDGAAGSIPGVEILDRDAEERRYQDMLGAAVDPRVANVRMRWIELVNGNAVLHIRVPASLNAPHRVTLAGHGHFYARHARGNYQMDVHQLRGAFASTDALPQRLRELHQQACYWARGVDMPFALGDGPRLAASFMPMSIFRDPRDLPVGWDCYVGPPQMGSRNLMPTIEGALSYPPVVDGMVSGFGLLHRAGRVDAGWSLNRGEWKGYQDVLSAEEIETSIEKWAFDSHGVFRSQGIEGPFVIFVTLQGIKGARLYPSMAGPAWRADVSLPPLQLSVLEPAALLPLYESVWRCFGADRPASVAWFR